MSRRMIQSLDVGGRGEAPRKASRRRRTRGTNRPALPLYTTYDICEMLVDIFLKPKDVIESRRLARNLWTTYHLQVSNRVARDRTSG